jgi:ABC-type amino acid transport substrate-binding protein
MRTFLLIAALVAAATQAAATTLERVKKTGQFTIAYRADAKPYSYQTDDGQPAGYIVELCREVADAVRKAVGVPVKVSYIIVPGDQRFAAVREGHADILCDPSTVTLERRKQVDFSMPTFLDGASVMSRETAPVNRFEDLRGKRVGVLKGTTTERVLRTSLAALGIKAEITTVRDHREGVGLLTSDKIDAYFGDRAILAAFLGQEPLPGFQVAQQYFSIETYALAIPHDDSAFRLLVDGTLARLYRTGKIRTLLTKTLGRLKKDQLLDALFVIHALPEK